MFSQPKVWDATGVLPVMPSPPPLVGQVLNLPSNPQVLNGYHHLNGLIKDDSSAFSAVPCANLIMDRHCWVVNTVEL